MGAEVGIKLSFEEFFQLPMGAKYLVEASTTWHQVLASTLFPGRQLPLDDLFDFREQF